MVTPKINYNSREASWSLKTSPHSGSLNICALGAKIELTGKSNPGKKRLQLVMIMN